MILYLLVLFALLTLLGVIFEEKTHINKAKITLFFGTLSWVVLFIAAKFDPEIRAAAGFDESIFEIASLWLFLMSAMTFVAYLNSKGMIENLIYLLLPKQLSEFRMMLLTASFCFLFSSLADNITATLISIALVLSLNLPPEKSLKFVVLVVFSVNSGGVALITGDVTTLMIFLDNRVSIVQLLLLSLPAFLGTLALALILGSGMNGQLILSGHKTEVRTVDVYIGILFLLTILSAMAANLAFSIPPVLTFLTGLGLMFLVARFCNEDIDNDPIMNYIRLIEFETLLFFLGVLLVVGALKEVQALEAVTQLYQFMSPVAANFFMGLLSAMIDNVPLTAALLKSSITMNTRDWMLLTYAVGVGGSLLIIGSAAGIVAMSKVQGLSFVRYLKFLPHLIISYGVGFCGVFLIGSLI